MPSHGPQRGVWFHKGLADGWLNPVPNSCPRSSANWDEANNPQQSWGFEGEPPEAVIKDSGTRVGTS
jgi:hypothetical protein